MTSATDNRTTELLPCPFCGGEAEFQMFDNACNVVCSDCHIGTRFESLDFHEQVVEAWNTRAELGSGTCEWVLEHSGTLYDKWCCSKCGYLFVEPRCDQGYTDLEPNFCPNCGRKVVDEC